jgi:hypothetical protein
MIGGNPLDWMDEACIKRMAVAGRFWTVAHEDCLGGLSGMPFQPYEGNNVLVGQDEVCALAATLYACAQAQDGLIPMTEMVRVAGAVSMAYVRPGGEPALYSAVSHMAVQRCPYPVLADRYRTEDEIQELAKAQGWPGEYIVLRNMRARAWVHFSDPRAAIVARLMLCGGDG